MSKIQDALRKLQKADQSRHSAGYEFDDSSPTIARVVRQKDLAAADSGSGLAKKVVNIDFELLRDRGLLAPTGQQRHIADQYRIIKRPLLDNASDRNAHLSAGANLIMVASPLPGDGKTFNCINLALSMATEKDKSVLLVDADVAKPHISSLFDLENEPGLIDLLIDEGRRVGELLLPTNVPGLSLLPAGRRDSQATELLASNRMARVVEELSRTYPDRMVIFDSPPLLVTSEARVLASRMGQIVLVVCAGVTPQHAVLAAVESLDPDKAISVILNQSSEGFGSGGYGGYGYGSGSIEQDSANSAANQHSS